MKPGVKTIVGGGVLLFLGAIALPLGVILFFLSKDYEGSQFVVPGGAEVQVEDSGRYYVWNDHETVFQGRSYNRPETLPDGMEITVMDPYTLETLQFFADSSISESGKNGLRRSIGYVEVKKPRRLIITVSGITAQRVFSFSESILLKIIGLVLGLFASTMLFGLGGVIIIVFGVVKFIKSRRQEQDPGSKKAKTRIG